MTTDNAYETRFKKKRASDKNRDSDNASPLQRTHLENRALSVKQEKKAASCHQGTEHEILALGIFTALAATILFLLILV